jgi:Mg2+ and Co2+ transporter CorA
VTERWLDLLDPTREELLEVLPTVVEDREVEMILAPPSDRPLPRLEGHADYVFGVLVAMAPAADGVSVENREVDFVATVDRLVTVRKTPGSGSAWPPECLEAVDGIPVGQLVFRLIDDVAQSYLEVVDAADAAIDELEDHIEDWPSVRVRRRISALRHELINARRTVGATRGKVRRISDKRLDTAGETLFPEEVERLFSDTYETLFRAGEELDVARDLLASSRDYHQALIAENQNEIVKKLTVIASLLLLPTLVVGFYGQNFVGVFGDFYWSIGVSTLLIVVTTIAQLALFRWQRWI